MITIKEIDTLFECVKLLTETASFTRMNPSVTTPAPQERYDELSEELMNVIRNNTK